jgi:hypothetical protein
MIVAIDRGMTNDECKVAKTPKRGDFENSFDPAKGGVVRYGGICYDRAGKPE